MSLRHQSAPKLQTQECQWQRRGSNSCYCKHPHPRASGRRWSTVSPPCTSQRSCCFGIIHLFIHSTSICSLSSRPGRALGCGDESERGSLQGSHGHLVSSLLPQPSDLSPLSSGACLSASGTAPQEFKMWQTPVLGGGGVCCSCSSPLKEWLPLHPTTPRTLYQFPAATVTNY